jgi:KDO2-lipid IV(A) lauroyltransferase
MNARFKFLVLFLIWHPFRDVVRALTSKRRKYGSLLRLGDRLGDLFHLAFPRLRRIIRDELGALGVYRPGAERATMRHIMKIEMEGMAWEDLDREMIERITEFRGLEHVDKALADGTGAMMILFHYGWHMHTLPALGYMGYPVHQIADTGPVDLKRKPPFLQRKVIKRRLRNSRGLPVTFFTAGKLLRPVFRVLQENKVLLLALDGREAKNFTAYDFLGQKIQLSPTILRVAQKTGSPVLPLFTWRGDDGRHRVEVHPPLTAEDPDGKVRQMLTIFEDYVRERPEQYAQYLLATRLASMRPERALTPLITSGDA